MRTRSARDIARKQLEMAGEKANGRGRAILNLSASRQTNLSIADLSKLPTAENATQLQTADGKFAFLLGYSTLASRTADAATIANADVLTSRPLTVTAI